MTNYSDLIARLRGTSELLECEWEDRDVELCCEAASALESLQGERDKMCKALRIAEVALEGVTPPKMAGANMALKHVRAALSQEDAPNA